MVCHGTCCSWTLLGLIGAFLDLAFAYFLLCVSALTFPASRFLSLFHLPCPCKGVLGFRSSSLCLHELLAEMPLRKIYSVQGLVMNRFPFSSVVPRDRCGKLNWGEVKDKGCDTGVLELDCGASCSLHAHGTISENFEDGEAEYDAKGKGISLNQKQRSGVRRRRRNRDAFRYWKLKSKNLGLALDNAEVRSQITENVGPVSGMEDRELDEEKPFVGIIEGEKTWHSYELSGPFDGSKGVNLDSCSIENIITNTMDTRSNRAALSKIKLLEQVLEEEKVARAALYLELEKERVAAATATDEAMAMISRLQEEKASMEMQLRQNQRMAEEKFTYDEEEMNLLKEILLRRERENYFLANEIEAYREIFSDDKITENHSSVVNDNRGKSPPPLHDPVEHLQSMVQEVMNGEDIDGSLIEPTHHCVGSNGHAPCDGQGREDFSENVDKKGCCLGNSSYDFQQVVHDVHVVDDKTEQRKNLPGTREEGIEQNGNVSSIGMSSRLSDTKRNSLSAAQYERLKLDVEIEWLREMLRTVQEGKEQLRLSEKGRDGEKAQLKLLEDIQNQLQEIQWLRGPMRHASLPNSFSKVKVEEKIMPSLNRRAHESTR